jgi:hypothetical protein
MALQFHPDKNAAPGADEAFKGTISLLYGLDHLPYSLVMLRQQLVTHSQS